MPDESIDERQPQVSADPLPSMLAQRVALTLGVNNLFDKDPPPCWSCSGANFDPGTYDAPGRFGYARVSYKM